MLLYRGTRLQSKRAYYAIQGALWVYALVWAAVIVALIYWYEEIVLFYKILLWIFIAIGAPAPPSALFQSYRSYREQWEKENGVQRPRE